MLHIRLMFDVDQRYALLQLIVLYFGALFYGFKHKQIATNSTIGKNARSTNNTE